MLIEKEIPIEDMKYYKYIEPSSLCFDIETTGLNKKFSHTAVIGTGCMKDGNIFFRQWLLDDPAQESEMLEEFSAYLKEFRSIIQFNGNSFDIPYITERCGIHGLSDPFTGMGLIDLYRSSKHLTNVSSLENFKQKSLEKLFDINRKDMISGRDCIFAYRDYLRYKDPRARDALLLHNEEDVLGLLKLYPLRNLDFIADEFKVSDISLIPGSENIRIGFELMRGLPFEIDSRCGGYSLYVSGDKGVLTLFPLLCVRKLFFKDYREYYYLPDEDRAIHKSVGVYVDPAHRQKAVKSNCYEKADGCFYRQYGEDILPAFKEDVKDKTFWFRSADIKKAAAEQIHALCRGYLKHIFKL
jgi:uncharacterized protein YprB with RNaseH-like and TPR domain